MCRHWEMRGEDMETLIDINLIDLTLQAENKDEVVRKMVDMLDAAGVLISKKGYLDDVFTREELGTTGFGMGLAIPHGKSDHVRRTAVSIARLIQPIDWNSLDGQPVNLVFLLAVPRSESDSTHLFVISQLASQLIDEEFRQKLCQAQDAQDIIELIKFNGVIK